MERTTEELIQTVDGLMIIAVMVYGFLLVAGAPFDKSPQWANEYARWGSRMTVTLIKLPFKMLFGKK